MSKADGSLVTPSALEIDDERQDVLVQQQQQQQRV